MKYPVCQAEIVRVRTRIVYWGRLNYKSFPWRDPNHNWHGLVAEIFLQRTRAENVVPVFNEFCKRYPYIGEFAAAGERELSELIQPLGLRKRAKQLSRLGNELHEMGCVPDDREVLESLTGVGPYTAAAWLSLHRGIAAAIIDSNVVRWLCRMTGRDYDRKLRRKKWLIDLADEITPKDNEKAREFNYGLLDFTRKICTPKRPSCSACPLGPEFCVYGAHAARAGA